MRSEARGEGVVETHVSFLLFLDGVVLKFKKPVRFPFVDLRSADSRRRACEAEVESNRRLSPDVYLGVADVSLDDQVLEHAVVMRRLPADRSLEGMAKRGDSRLEAELRALAALLDRFHARAARSALIDSAATAEAIARLWNQSFEVLHSSGAEVLRPEMLAEARELAGKYTEGRGPLFAERITLGRICEGHGDLLTSDVFFLDDGPRVLDCVEFDEKLRHVDVIADVAFLVMDLERIGAREAARQFVDYYQEVSGERFPATLLDHYCAQRALVRAEVACLRLAQGDPNQADEASSLLDLALEHLHRGRVVLGVVCGLPGTGKSTLCDAAAETLGWPVLRSDEVRRELVDPRRATPLVAAFETGPYTSEVSDRTYDLLLERARHAISHGRSVLLDATFREPRSRRHVEELARSTSTDLVVVWCEASRDVTDARLRSRTAEASNLSGANEAISHRMAAESTQWPGAKRIDTSRRTVAECAESLVEHLGYRGPPPDGPAS